MRHSLPTVLLLLIFSSLAYGAEPSSITIQDGMLHLRNAGPREWAEFSETADAELFEKTFEVDKEKPEAKESTGWTLRLRQQDIKQQWTVRFNDRVISTLIKDENDIVHFIEVPPASVKQGTNRLTISTKEDVLVGDIVLYAQSKEELFSQNRIDVHALTFETKQPTPCRLTIVDENGSLFETNAVSNNHMAVRPGVIYTSNGKAEFNLPTGKYIIYAGRGFEYALSGSSLECKDGTGQSIEVYLKREVPTPGYVACDTHTHTRTHSGHGDSTVEERMITLAGEGIEFPITTDHNVILIIVLGPNKWVSANTLRRSWETKSPRRQGTSMSFHLLKEPHRRTTSLRFGKKRLIQSTARQESKLRS